MKERGKRNKQASNEAKDCIDKTAQDDRKVHCNEHINHDLDICGDADDGLDGEEDRLQKRVSLAFSYEVRNSIPR